MEHIAAEQDRRKAKGPASVYRALKSFWSWYADEYSTADPMARARRPRVKIPRTEDLLRAVEKATAGQDSVSLRNRLIVPLLAGAGIRRSEPCGIRMGDFSEDFSVVQVSGKTGTQIAVLDRAAQLVLHRYLAPRLRGRRRTRC